MKSMFQKLLIGGAAAGMLLMPAAAHAISETPPSTSVQCSTAKAQLAAARANYSAYGSLAASYQTTINSLLAAGQRLVNLGLGESPTYSSLTTQINYYQTLQSSALQTQGYWEGQINYWQGQVSQYCYST